MTRSGVDTLNSRMVAELERFVGTKGCIVSVIGPDGSGKSTLIQALHDTAREARIEAVRIHSYRWHRNVFYMPLRLLMLKRRGEFVLLDRCLFDNLVELNVKLPLPRSLRKALTKLVCALYGFVDVRILLQAPPDVIAARRPEESPEKTSKQASLYEELMSDAAYRGIDSTRPTLQPAICEIRRRLVE